MKHKFDDLRRSLRFQLSLHTRLQVSSVTAITKECHLECMSKAQTEMLETTPKT